jgi:hypothetical protein
MVRQHGAQLGISIAALDMARASTRSQATFKVPTEAGTSAVKRGACLRHRALVLRTKPYRNERSKADRFGLEKQLRFGRFVLREISGFSGPKKRAQLVRLSCSG